MKNNGPNVVLKRRNNKQLLCWKEGLGHALVRMLAIFIWMIADILFARNKQRRWKLYERNINKKRTLSSLFK